MPLIEQGLVDTPQMEQTLRALLGPYVGRLDALVLGCTHYPFASHAMERLLGPGVEVLDGGAGTARETRHRLEAAGLLENGPGELILENSLGTPEILGRSRRMLGLE